MSAEQSAWSGARTLPLRADDLKDAWAVLLAQVTRVLSGSDAALLRSVG